jgi:hypothetical protein
LVALNDRVLPFYDQQQVSLLRILTDRGTEFCGQREHHEYELYLAIEDIDHTKTKARSPQTAVLQLEVGELVSSEIGKITTGNF